ncbi:MAG: twin transmembrane helix small protein [Paracoccaceae bacterium]
MANTFLTVAVAACLVTLIIVMIGIVGFGTGTTSTSFSQRMMRWRIVAQFVAIILIMITVLVARNGG